MAASSNPGGNNQEAGQGSGFNGQANPNNSGTITPTTTSAANGTEHSVSLKHDPGLAVEWSIDEQSILEDGLAKFADESNILRYVKIATLLPDKTVRDVALRCRWMTKKESGKRRKAEEQNSAKKIKDKKDKAAESSVKAAASLVARPNMPVYNSQLLSLDNDDGVSYEAIGGTTGQLLQQNVHVFNQITTNLAAYQIQENIDLFCRTRDNIAAILNEMNDKPGIMSQMPPLPVKVNEELVNTILPKASPAAAALQS